MYKILSVRAYTVNYSVQYIVSQHTQALSYDSLATLYRKIKLNKNRVVRHYQCISNVLIMHYNALKKVHDAFVILFSSL